MSTRDRQWAAARRATAAALHPDRGGDPEVFIAAFAALDTTHGRLAPGGARPTSVVVIVRHPRWRRVIALIHRTLHRMTGTRRHYAHL
ncbi:MAG: hypothetical protein QOC58_959 [Mycobacterium sp.]|jgi:hypothetical protein|nr:hypothetical protein [Mycobacterium sp.]